jgi:hypothetical protein
MEGSLVNLLVLERSVYFSVSCARVSYIINVRASVSSGYETMLSQAKPQWRFSKYSSMMVKQS